MREAIGRGWAMRKTEVRRDELLVTVKENRKKHAADHAEAVAAYRSEGVNVIADVMKQLMALRVKMVEKGDDVPALNVDFRRLPPPKSHDKSYAQVIRMLEMEQREVITLEASEFACFVMDDWDWKDDFSTVLEFYKVGGKAK
jgi:hypothetical protein